MSKLKYAIAMLAVGGATGGASQAAAAVTEHFDFGPTTSPGQSIFLAGETLNPQFAYRDGSALAVKYYLDAFGTAKIDPTRYDNDALPTSGALMTSMSVQTFEGDPIFTPDCEVTPELCLPTTLAATGDSYWRLSFDAGGEHYLGTAHIDGDQVLRTITYDTAANLAGGVPEPDTWALMILGVGAAGAVLRRARRTQPDATAA